MTETSPETTALPGRSGKVPGSVVRLTALGFVPFLGLAVGTLVLSGAHQQIAVEVQLVYGAVILSFLGGIHWGWELAVHVAKRVPVSAARLVIGVLPSIFGWAALLLPDRPAALVLAVCFAGVLGYDLTRTRAGLAPEWYPVLRIPVSLAVIAALLLPAVAG